MFLFFTLVSVPENLISGKFRAEQFHMHWGEDDSCGSEHQVDGKPFSAEIHFVHWNSEKYKSFGESAKTSCHDGLLVLGVFVKVRK